MLKSNQSNSSDESDENDTYALNALRDLDDASSVDTFRMEKLKISFNEKNDNCDIENTMSIISKELQKSLSKEKESEVSIKTSDSTYLGIKTPTTDPKSVPASPDKPTHKTNFADEISISYTPDFTEDTNNSQEEMTPWDKWFVTKQLQLRRQSEVEKMKKLMEDQKQEHLRQKKAAENERRYVLWLERKKLEEIEKKEKAKEITEKEAKDKAMSEYKFENWYQKKLQEKKSQLQHNQQQKKYEEVQRELRQKRNERAHMEWMAKAKQRPLTPRITYAYVGDSVIGFYDSTSHPPPAYVNPIPWQS